jgi:hypothetical protein
MEFDHFEVLGEVTPRGVMFNGSAVLEPPPHFEALIEALDVLPVKRSKLLANINEKLSETSALSTPPHAPPLLSPPRRTSSIPRSRDSVTDVRFVDVCIR